MKKHLLFVLAAGLTLLHACQDPEPQQPATASVSADVTEKLKAAGFDTSEGLSRYKDGYLVEYDIFLTEKQIDGLIAPQRSGSGKNEHYRTNNLVTGTPRTLKVYMDTGFGTYMQNSFDIALSRYNSEPISLRFQRVSSASEANISILSFYENSNVLGYSAGFPTGGNPASPIRLNTFYYNNSSQRTDAATVIAHEIGHAVGFRHTDYMNRAFSCGSGGNEGDAGVGAVHIPGTPTTPSANSWMLACSSNTDRPFTADDKNALAAVYPIPVGPSARDLFVIAKSNTGSGTTEVHGISSSSNYQNFFLQTGSALGTTGNNFDFLIGDYNRDGIRDVYCIKKSQTGSNSTEIHILNGATNYQSFLLNTGTVLHETGDTFDFVLGDYNDDGQEDIYAIKKSATGTNSTEIHVLNGVNNYQGYLLNTGTVLGETGANFEFALGDYNRDGKDDIYVIKKSATGTNSTEIHVLNGANNYQSFLAQTGTALPETGDNYEFSVADHNQDGQDDVYAIQKNNTSSNKTEIRILNGANFSAYLLQTATVLGTTDNTYKLIIR